jgi:hypothetical protein
MAEHEISWAQDRQFKQGGVVVTVWKLALRRPQFRFDIGCEGRDPGKTFRQFAVFTEGQGKLKFRHAWDPEVASQLVTQALEYIYGECQSVEDERIEQKAAYEQRGLIKDKPRQKLGLKELAKRDKALRQLQEKPED